MKPRSDPPDSQTLVDFVRVTHPESAEQVEQNLPHRQNLPKRLKLRSCSGRLLWACYNLHTTYILGALPMFHSTESDPSFPNVSLIEQALRTLKQSVTTHLEHEVKFERLCSGWQKKWFSQCEELRFRIESLEARLAPWMTDRTDGPRLAIISQQEDAA